MKTQTLLAFIFSITAITVTAMSLSQSDTHIIKPKLPVAQKNAPPKVELVFVLDTTSSMSGLIKAAKEKIWSIASTMASANPAPEISIGIVGFRDRGDAYITKKIDLSKDLDSIYAALLDFKAQGEGDTPESVNEAIFEAVNNMSWSQDPDSYKVIFLVGDAPGHDDYQNDVPFETSLAVAAKKGIIVNTIQAGINQQMKKSWQIIASLGKGKTFQVGQEGNAVAISTPFDDAIATASKEFESTRLFFGNKEEKAKQKISEAKVQKIYANSSAGSLARRAKYNSSKSGESNFANKNEMIQAIEKDEISLSELKVESLPIEMQNMEAAERATYVQVKTKQRKDARRKLKVLSEKRDQYIKAELAKSKSAPASLDDKMLTTLKAQAGKKGLDYTDKENSY